jgi:arylsulfatase A-like enzyme
MRHLILVLVFGVLFTNCKETGKQIDHPNIVLFYIDDLGWKDTGYMGSDFYETPHLDALAADGLVFTNAYSNGPNCAPSRASLMSGQYTPRHGVFTVGDPARGEDDIRKLVPTENKEVLDTGIVTLAEALKSNGYHTIHLGKWHLGDSSTVRKQGFDYNIGGYSQGGPYLGGYYSPFHFPNLLEQDSGIYLTDRLTDEAVSFIRSHQKQPFFMYFSHYAVHTPIKGRKDLIRKYQNLQGGELHHHIEYAAMVESVDISFGRIFHTLDSLDLLGNTLIIFYSDNGGLIRFTTMDPLRGYKGTIYEGGIRVPMAMYWQGVIQPGRRTDYPVIGTDLYPTILKLTDTPAPGQVLDGLDLSCLLKGETMKNRGPMYWHFPAYLQGEPGSSDNMRIRPSSAIRDGKYKLIEYFENGKIELYDLELDIGEENNLADELPLVKQELHQKLKRWIKEINAPIPTVLNPAFHKATFDALELKYGDDLIIKEYYIQ